MTTDEHIWCALNKCCLQEAELVEARLAQSQAQAKAQRAQQRLDELLEDQASRTTKEAWCRYIVLGVL